MNKIPSRHSLVPFLSFFGGMGVHLESASALGVALNGDQWSLRLKHSMAASPSLAQHWVGLSFEEPPYGNQTNPGGRKALREPVGAPMCAMLDVPSRRSGLANHELRWAEGLG